MTLLANYVYPPEVMALVGPVVQLLDRGLTGCGEAALASLTLWALDELDAGALKPEMADDAFTLLDVYLTDHAPSITLSDEAQELLFEGEHLHHYREDWGPDLVYIRGLADKILSRAV